MATIKQQVEVIINATPRLQADISGNDWPPHSHADHTGLAADDHTHYMTNAAGPSRHHTGDVYFDEKIMSSSDLQFDDNYRYTHTDGGGDWDQDHIKLSGGPGEWQDLYNAAGGIVSIIEGITMGITAGGGGGGVTLQGAYDFGGPGAGRSILAANGAVEINVPDGANNAALKLLQNDVTNNKDCLDLYHQGTGNLIYVHGTSSNYKIYTDGIMTIQTVGNLTLNAGSNLIFDDGHRTGWIAAMPLSANSTEWTNVKNKLFGGTGAGSLFGAILSAAHDLQGCYDYDSPGAGGTIIAADGAVEVQVPDGSNNAVLNLLQYDSTYNDDVLTIYNTGTGDSVYMHGAGVHSIYADGDLSIGANGEIGILSQVTGSAAIDIEADGTTGGTLTFTAASNAFVDAGSVFRVDVGAKCLFRIQHDGINPDIIFSDNYIYDNWTQQFVSLLDDGSEALQYVSDFGEVSIFNALHQCTGGGSISRPDKEVIWGTTAAYSSEPNFTYDDDYNQVRIINNHNETNWYDTNAASLLLQGTATQGNAVVANGNLVIGSVHSTINNTTSLIARSTDASSTYHPEIYIAALPTAGSAGSLVTIIADRYGGGVGVVNITANGIGGEGYSAGTVNITAYAQGSSDQTHEINLTNKVLTNEYSLILKEGWVDLVSLDWIDFNDNTSLYHVKSYDFGASPETSTPSSGTLTVDFDDGPKHVCDFNADISTFNLSSVNGILTGAVLFTNTDSSAHTVASPSSTAWTDGEDGSSGFSVAASEVVEVIFEYWGSTKLWKASIVRFA